MSDNKEIELAKGIGVAAEKALDFIEKIVAAPIMEGTGIFTDKVKFWRFKNQVDIILKARKVLEAKGIETPNKVPIKDLTTLLEHASFEEDEVMQDSWANLLANTMDPNNKFDSCHLFSHVLNQLSINEIYILQHAFSVSFIRSSDDRPYLKRSRLIENSFSEYQTGLLLIDNLLRLRLVEEEPPRIEEKYSNNHPWSEVEPTVEEEVVWSECFRLSQFGTELMRQISK